MTKVIEKADGHAGERKAAALMTVALCAETSHATLAEEGSKIDLKISFRSVLQANSTITAHCQVKAGKSFRAPASTSEILTMQNIGSDTISSLRDGTHPALLLWVPPKPSARVYWHLVHPTRAPKSPIRIPKGQFVSPSLRIDLSRDHAYEKLKGRLSRITLPESASDQPRSARRQYQELRKRGIQCPIAGKIEVTRRGWRHVSRRSRNSISRIRSFRLTSYLDRILSAVPSRYLVTNREVRISGVSTHESREVIFWYEDAISENGKLQTVLIRLLEEVSYPKTWPLYGLSSSEVECRPTLLSWWYKPSKKDAAPSGICTDASDS